MEKILERQESNFMIIPASFYDHMRDISKQEKISVSEAMQAAAEMGIEQLEVSENCILGREREVERELAASGLEISSIPSYFDFGRNTDVQAQSVATLETARYFGVKRLLVIPGFFAEGDDENARAKQVENMKNCINQLGESADKYGISLVMEDYDSTLAHFSTAEGVRDFLDNCPRLDCCFDTGNFRFSAQDELAAYDLLSDRIKHVHFKDRSYEKNDGCEKIAVDGQPLYPCAVGSGEIKLKELVRRLKSDGYSGVIAAEQYGAANALETLRRSVEWIKENW